MKSVYRFLSFVVAGLWVASLAPAALACATCGCTLSSDAAMGYSSSTGWRLNLQYDYIDQNQLRAGSHRISSSAVAAINDAGGEQEVERDTINRYLTAGLSYAPNASWNFKLLVPYVVRTHTTYGEATNPLTDAQISGAAVNSLGDIKTIVSFQGLLPKHNLGIQFGFKLPTGNYGGPNAAGDGAVGHDAVTFTRGPIARVPSPGNFLDTSLQAGTGSTDLIIGAYYFEAISQNFDAFINAQFQTPVTTDLDERGANFLPGNQTTASVGLRYEAYPKIQPELQVNLSHKTPDRGALADTIGSGGTVVYISPGVSANVIGHLQFYGFVQVPVYKQLDGIQLFPHWTATVGLSYAF